MILLQRGGRDILGGDRHVPGLEELLGQFDQAQRSLVSAWSKGPNSYIYRLCAPRASRDQSDVIIEKGWLFDERIGLDISKPTLAAACSLDVAYQRFLN
jgi:hypothetical protein